MICEPSQIKAKYKSGCIQDLENLENLENLEIGKGSLENLEKSPFSA